MINKVIEYSSDDDEPSEDEILSGLRQALIEVLAGNTRPAHEVLDEIEREHAEQADENEEKNE